MSAMTSHNLDDARVEVSARPAALRRSASAIDVEATLPIKRLWFDKIASGEKTTEFREASPFWCCRLLGRPSLQRVRLLNGRSPDAPYLVCELRGVEKMPVAEIPRGLAPEPGSREHRDLFRNVGTVLALHLGAVLELHDPKRRSQASPTPAKKPGVPHGVDPPRATLAQCEANRANLCQSRIWERACRMRGTRRGHAALCTAERLGSPATQPQLNTLGIGCQPGAALAGTAHGAASGATASDAPCESPSPAVVARAPQAATLLTPPAIAGRQRRRHPVRSPNVVLGEGALVTGGKGLARGRKRGQGRSELEEEEEKQEEHLVSAAPVMAAARSAAASLTTPLVGSSLEPRPRLATALAATKQLRLDLWTMRCQPKP